MMKKMLTLLLSSSLALSSISGVLAQEADENAPAPSESVETPVDPGGASQPSGDPDPDPAPPTPDPGAGEDPGSGTEDPGDPGEPGDPGDPDPEVKDPHKPGGESTSGSDQDPGDNNDETSQDQGGDGEDERETPEPDPAPAPAPPQRPAPSNDPGYYRLSRPVQRPNITQPVELPSLAPEEPEPETEPEVEEPGLLDGPYIVFHANIFLTEAEADDFIQMMEEDEEAGDRFTTEKIVNDNGSVIVLVNYAEDASEEGRAILFYVETQFEDEEAGHQYAEDNLLIYPDLFFDAEVIEVDGVYNVIFGIQSTADTQAFTYDEESFEIDYQADREPFSYIIEPAMDGSFEDPIADAVEAAFPGEFAFDYELYEDSQVKATMIPLEKEEAPEAEESSESDSQ